MTKTELIDRLKILSDKMIPDKTYMVDNYTGYKQGDIKYWITHPTEPFFWSNIASIANEIWVQVIK